MWDIKEKKEKKYQIYKSFSSQMWDIKSELSIKESPTETRFSSKMWDIKIYNRESLGLMSQVLVPKCGI